MKTVRSSNTNSLFKGSNKNQFSLEENNFVIKKRDSSFKKLNAVIQEVMIILSEIDDLFIRFKNPINKSLLSFSNKANNCSFNYSMMSNP